MSHTFLMESAKECCLSSSESGPYSMRSPMGSKSTTATNPSKFCAEDAPYYPITEAATPSCLVGIEPMDESTQ